jgi:hypothetical protein
MMLNQDDIGIPLAGINAIAVSLELSERETRLNTKELTSATSMQKIN